MATHILIVDMPGDEVKALEDELRVRPYMAEPSHASPIMRADACLRAAWQNRKTLTDEINEAQALDQAVVAVTELCDFDTPDLNDSSSATRHITTTWRDRSRYKSMTPIVLWLDNVDLEKLDPEALAARYQTLLEVTIEEAKTQMLLLARQVAEADESINKAGASEQP